MTLNIIKEINFKVLFFIKFVKKKKEKQNINSFNLYYKIMNYIDMKKKKKIKNKLFYI